MWLGELATRARVPTATVKFYLREGLLPVGAREGSSRAEYDERHLARLRLVRALVTVAGMGLDDVRRVLDALDQPEVSMAEAMGAAHLALSPTPAAPPSAEHSARVARLVADRGWRVEPDGPHGVALAAALDAMAAADHPLADEALETYADAMTEVGRSDTERAMSLERDDAVALAVAGTVLADPVLIALRRIVQQDAARDPACVTGPDERGASRHS